MYTLAPELETSALGGWWLQWKTSWFFNSFLSTLRSDILCLVCPWETWGWLLRWCLTCSSNCLRLISLLARWTAWLSLSSDMTEKETELLCSGPCLKSKSLQQSDSLCKCFSFSILMAWGGEYRMAKLLECVGTFLLNCSWFFKKLNK